jgi:hypothetical protein
VNLPTNILLAAENYCRPECEEAPCLLAFHPLTTSDNEVRHQGAMT